MEGETSYRRPPMSPHTSDERVLPRPSSRQEPRESPGHALGSDEEEDPLEMAMLHEPFRELTRKEEENRLLADGYDATPGHWDTLAQEVGHRARKRRRTGGEEGEGESAWEMGRPRPIPAVREHGSVFFSADPVTLGWCSEEEGRELFKACVSVQPELRLMEGSLIMRTPFFPSLIPRRITGTSKSRGGVGMLR